MSAIERDLMQSVGMSVAQVAGVLGKTRQAVHRGLKKNDHYLNGSELFAIYSSLPKEGPKRTVFRSKICEYFPDSAAHILDAIDNRPVQSDPKMGETFWLITGDFASFESSPNPALRIFKDICSDPGKSVAVYVNRGDFLLARRFMREYEKDKYVFRCGALNLSVLPTLLVVDGGKSQPAVFSLTNSGFSPLETVDREKWLRKLMSYVSEENELADANY